MTDQQKATLALVVEKIDPPAAIKEAYLAMLLAALELNEKLLVALLKGDVDLAYQCATAVGHHSMHALEDLAQHAHATAHNPHRQ